jgi:hypothetical protein
LLLLHQPPFKPESNFPAQINDVKGAIRLSAPTRAKYQLNTTFLGIIGDSSGGHLSTLAGTSGGIVDFTVGTKKLAIEGDVGGNLNQSSRVDAVVDWYGPNTFQKMDSCGSQFSHDEVNSPESTLIGGPIQKTTTYAHSQIRSPTLIRTILQC